MISGVGGRQAFSSDQDPTKAARLCITYESSNTFHAFEQTMDSEKLRTRLYPNPTRGNNIRLQVTRSVDEPAVGSVNITDLYGKELYGRQLILSAKFHEEVLNLNGALARGVYLVNIRIDGILRTERLVVQ